MLFGEKFPHTQQLESKDCGPACLQMLCKYYGLFYELEYLRELTGIRKEGISVHDFIVASEKLGFRSSAFRLSFHRLVTEVPLPCTVHWKGYHFVIIYKIDKKYVYVSDPQEGLVRHTHQYFTNGWLHPVGEKESKGVCIVSEPTNEFKKAEGGQATQKRTGYLDMFKYIWTYMSAYKSSALKVVFLMVVITLISALLPIITQSIIDVGIPSKDKGFIMLMMIASIFLTLGNAMGAWMKQLLNTHFAARMKISMQADFIASLFKLPQSFFENRLMGDIMQRSYDYDRIETMVMNAAFNFILGILQLLIFGGILFAYNTTIFWIFLVASILYVVWVIFFWNIRKRMDVRYFTFLAHNQSHWIEMLSKTADIKSYNYNLGSRWKWEKTQVNLFKIRLKLLNVEQVQNIGSALLTSFKDVLLIYIASLAVMNGEMTIGVLIAIQYILGQLRIPMDSMVNFIVSSQLSNISFVRISEISNIKQEDNPELIDEKLIDFKQPIVLRGVSYKYSINDDYALRNITCFIPKGKTVALVGESGCGKSTLIKLLAKLYAPASGDILLGKQKLSSVSSVEWRNRCAVINQESALLKDSILNNILMGREFDDEQLHRSVTIANIKSEIERMPLSYNTMIKENEKGVSEGQKQRILLSRAIYGNPEYLFLDEITSSLDSKNEFAVIHAIKSYNEQLTTVVLAAHRLSSVQQADLIMVLKDGMIVEVGTHDVLWARQKEYYMLFKSQIVKHNGE
jgi:ATP-binding cassette subfamily B protein